MEHEVDRQHPFFRSIGLPIGRAIGWLLLTLLGPFKARNKRNVPRSGGLLILSNHLADIDPVAIQVACPRPIYFMAKSELFEMKGLGRIIRMFRAFPVKRGEPDRGSIKTAVNYLKAGETVCVFPEGELSEDGHLLPLKPGIALIVRMAGVPVICCGLKNTNRVMPYGSLIPRPAFRLISASWGETREFTKADDTEAIVGWVDSELRRLTGQPAVELGSVQAEGA